MKKGEREKGRKGEGERGRCGEKATRRHGGAFSFAVFLFLALPVAPSPRRPVALSPCRPVALSPCLPVSPSSAAAHKYHFSFTQVEYNAKEKSVEITMRVFADDLEAALSKHSGKAVKLDHKDAAALIAEYVRARFEFKGRAGRAKKLSWIGLESKVDVALLYFEAKMPEGMNGAQLRHRVFFELFDDQVNQVLLKADASKASLEFKAGDGFKWLALPPK